MSAAGRSGLLEAINVSSFRTLILVPFIVCSIVTFLGAQSEIPDSTLSEKSDSGGTRHYEIATDRAAILSLQGRVTRSGADGAWHAVTEGTLLAAGESIQTGKASMAALLLSDQTVMKMAAETRFSIVDLRREPGGQLVRRFDLSHGRLWSDVTPRTHPESIFEVRGSQAVAAVKGTSFEVSADDESTDMVVFEGEVEGRRPGQGSVRLVPDRQNRWQVRRGHRPALSRHLIDHGDDWQRWNWSNAQALRQARAEGRLSPAQIQRLKTLFRNSAPVHSRPVRQRQRDLRRRPSPR